MPNLIIKYRKSTVLRHPSLPCFESNYTVNLLSGCPFECKYCYTRSFRSNPRSGEVQFFANTVELFYDEIRRKRKKLPLVYFSTACEPFVPWPEVQEALFRIMKELLDLSVPVLVSTKSIVPDRFIDLFCTHPDMVYIQIGISTLNDSIRNLLEPGAVSVGDRFRCLNNLVEQGIHVEVRMDPLIPGLTDDEDDFDRLCKEISSCGVYHASASYLFLRKQTIQSMKGLTFDGWCFDEMFSSLFTTSIENYCGGGRVQIASLEYRSKKFALLKCIAADNGIALKFCRCKNPDLTKDCCHPVFPIQQPKQCALF